MYKESLEPRPSWSKKNQTYDLQPCPPQCACHPQKEKSSIEIYGEIFLFNESAFFQPDELPTTETGASNSQVQYLPSSSFRIQQNYTKFNLFVNCTQEFLTATPDVVRLGALSQSSVVHETPQATQVRTYHGPIAYMQCNDNISFRCASLRMMRTTTKKTSFYHLTSLLLVLQRDHVMKHRQLKSSSFKLRKH